MAILAPAAMAADTIYGYEDNLGMLHLSRTKVSARYSPLYDYGDKILRIGGRLVAPQLGARPFVDRTPPLSMDEARSRIGPEGARILDAAAPYLGAPYVFGGEAPSGVDCSAFTRAVFKRLGRDLPRSSREQAACGLEVSRDAMAPGDLLFFAPRPGQGVSHVGIFLGGDVLLHATSRTGRVTVQTLTGSPYPAWFVSARRIPGAASDADRNVPGKPQPPRAQLDKGNAAANAASN